MLHTLARAITTLGPIGRHSRRPALMATALALALFGFLPAAPAPRIAAAGLVVLVAEASVRLRRSREDAPGERAPGGTPARDEIVVDRFAGMWCALVPLPRELWLLLAAFVLFRLLESRSIGPVRWAVELAGGPRSVLDDVVAGLVTGVTLLFVYKLLYAL